MALRRQVINLIRLHVLNDAHQAAAVRHVSVVEKETAVQFVRVLVEMVDAVGVEQGTAALYAMHLVSLGEQQLGKIRAILSCDAGNESLFH